MPAVKKKYSGLFKWIGNPLFEHEFPSYKAILYSPGFKCFKLNLKAGKPKNQLSTPSAFPIFFLSDVKKSIVTQSAYKLGEYILIKIISIRLLIFKSFYLKYNKYNWFF